MLINHLKSAWRNIRKRKEFSILNVLGLSIGMAACLLILQYVDYEKSYDNFHPDLSQLYRLNLKQTNPGSAEMGIRAENHPAAGPAIKRDFPQVESFARLVKAELFFGPMAITYEGGKAQKKTFFEEELYFADSSFLTMMGFPMILGDAKTALSGRNDMVITESMAKRYFGDENPLGKTITQNGWFKGTITGVLKDLPENSHIKFDGLFSSAFFSPGVSTAWIWPEFHTYLKLSQATNVANFEKELDGFVHKYLGEITAQLGLQVGMELQPIKDIHLFSDHIRSSRQSGNYKMISFLILLAVMILLIAWINYINLSTARSVERASEVGVRKVVGANKSDIIIQFLMESALLNVLAILLALNIVTLAAPAFNQLVGKTVIQASQLFSSTNIWLGIAAVFIGGTFLAGLYPAFVLSSFQPIKTIKGQFYSMGRKWSFRQALVVFQFAVSIIMIVGTGIIFNQMSFMRNQDLGFNLDQMLVVKTPTILDTLYNQKSKRFLNTATNISKVVAATNSSDIPGHIIQNNNSIYRKGQTKEESIFSYYIFTDEDYLSAYDIELVAGRNFSKDKPTDKNAVLINEKTANLLGFSSPEAAIGQVLTRKLNEWQDVSIVGVVKNINHRSLAHQQDPFVFFNDANTRVRYFNFKVSTTNINSTIAQIESNYKEIFPNNPFNYFFLDDYFGEQYKADQKFGAVFGLFAGLANLVAILGLFGLSSYIISRRKKEIGVRKILGASGLQIFVMLGKQFMVLVFIAAALAIPLCWWGGEQWLSNYAYAADLSIWLFLLPILIVLLLAILTVVLQSTQVVRTNPVEALRQE